MSTCNRLDLGTLGYGLVMPKNPQTSTITPKHTLMNTTMGNTIKLGNTLGTCPSSLQTLSHHG